MVVDIYSKAQMAQAAYANLIGVENANQLETALTDTNGGVFSSTQAIEFARNWRVADHQPDSSSGFSATLFERLDDDGARTGTYALAMRGTSGVIDISEDIYGVAAQGIAREQAADLYRYYRCLTTPAGASVEYTTQEILLLTALESGSYSPLTTTVAYLEVLARTSQDTGLGELNANARIDITGHSLGGHLAMLFSVMFPEAVNHVYTYNGAGLGGIGAELLDLAGYNGVIPNHQVTNIVSDQGLDVTAGVGYVIGDTERIFIEQGSGIHNHSIANAVDSLAIYNLLASIDTSATLGRLSSILAAMVSHADRARTYESVVYALSDLFIAPIDVVTGNRDGLYQAIQAIETELFVDREVSVPQLETAYQNLTVEPLTDLTQDQIVTTAIGDIGYRYALTHLNPFAITGSESLYDDHNQNGELELNNSIIQEGELTQNYLTDRVAFLNTLNSFNRTNELVVGDHLIEFQDWDNGLIRRSAMITATDDAVSQRILFGDEQRDTFTGGTDHDRLYGGGGNDTLSGHAGDDGIEGNAGIDTLNGGLGDDALYGGADNDTLDGGNERDLLVGGRGEDHLIAGSENDILVGGYYLYDVASNISIYYDDDTPDRLEGGIGDDLYYADGGDTVNDEDGDGLIKMTVNLADGTEALVDLASSFWWTQNGVSNDYTVYIEPFDVSLRYVYDESSQILRVSQVNHPGNLVTIENFVNRDFGIRLGGGASVPDESYWRVTVYPDGSLSQPIEECYLSYDPWWYVAEHGDSAEPVLDENILGTEEADEIDAGNGDDVVHADDGNDQVHGNAGNDQLFGEGGNDTLYGDEGNDRLLGGDGLDRLFGGLGNDTLRGGLGNGDVLEGGLGNDTYFYAEGDGNTTINNFDNMIGRLDVLRFLDGVSAADVVATRTDYDLVLTLSGSAETITVTDYFVGDGVGYSLDLIEFAGGTQWDIDQIKTQVQQATVGDDYLYGYAEADTLEGLEGNDTLYGMSGDDILRGGAGNDRMYGNAGNDRLFGDTGVDEIYGGDGNDWIRGNGGDGDILNGGTGNDTYVFGDGDGDTIIQNHDAGEGRHDVLRFRDGITSDDIEVSRSEYDLLLTRVSSGEAITVSGYFYEDGGWTRALDEIRFEDGTSWDTGTILARVLLGSDEDDTIFGYSGDDTIEGMAGNDTLVGEAGDDTLSGGVGFDLLYGGDGDDRIEGGPDHDRLAGESGNDYLVGGSGHDTLNGGDGDDILICGNDTCIGEAGNDTYIHLAGSGDLDIFNNDPDAESVDELIIEGVAPAGVTMSRRGGDTLKLQYQVENRSEFINLHGYFSQDSTTGQTVDLITFSDHEMTWDIDYVREVALSATDGEDWLYCSTAGDTLHGKAGDDHLYGAEGVDHLYGDAGNDELVGGGGDDTLSGGAGNDQLQGGSGDDTLSGGAGDDRLNGGPGSDQYLFNSGDGNDWIAGDYVDPDTDDVNRLVFGEGLSEEDLRFVRRTDGSLLIELLDSDDSVAVGSYFNPAVYSGSYQLDIGLFDGTVITREEITALVSQVTDQSDIFVGTDEADSVHLLRGDDEAIGGEGNDELFGDQGNDRLSGEGGDDLLYGGVGEDILTGGTGDDSLFGGAGDDDLSGGPGDDILRGGAGRDELTGNRGNDTYRYGLGDGNIIIDNLDRGEENNDILRFLEGIAPTDIDIERLDENLQLTLQDGGKVWVRNYFQNDGANDYALHAIEFNDGNSWTYNQVAHLCTIGSEEDDRLIGTLDADSIDGLGGDDRIYGRDGNDNLNGGSGDDNVFGEAGDDTLNGNDGNDYLYGGDGDDVLQGGAGYDRLTGGRGSDTYIYGMNDDSINIFTEYDDMDGGDVLRFVEGISPEDLIVRRTRSTALQISWSGSDAAINVSSYFSDENQSNNVLSAIEFYGGTQWDYEQIVALSLLATEADDEIHGTDGTDVLESLGGEDNLYGGEGDDELNGGVGNDDVYGEGGNDRVQGGAGDDSLSGGEGNDILLGGLGDDSLSGGMGNDILSGGGGSDVLQGNEGDDIYRYSVGDGDIRINNYETVEGFRDVLHFQQGIDPIEIEVRNNDDDLLLTHLSSGDTITVMSYFENEGVNSYVLQAIEFSDGTVWSYDQLEQLSMIGTDGADDIYGSSKSDHAIIGGSGDDFLFGGEGEDLLTGDADNDYLIGQEGNDHLLGGSGEDFLFGSTKFPDRYEMENLRSTLVDENYGWDTWNQPAWVDDMFAEYDLLQGGEGSDVLIGTGELYGGAGDDQLLGSGVLYGETGDDYIITQGANSGKLDNDWINDYIQSEPGSQFELNMHILLGYGPYEASYKEARNRITVVGGQGNDILEGSYRTTYHFELGDGQDTIYNNNYDLGDSWVSFGSGIHASSVVFERNEADLVVRYGAENDSITISEWFVPISIPGSERDGHYLSKIDYFEFADGSTITGAQAETGLTTDSEQPVADDPPVEPQPADDIAMVGDSKYNILHGGAGDDDLNGAGNHDVLLGESGDDILRGGAGNDTLFGGNGNDIYLYGVGDEEEIIFNRDSDGGTDVLRFLEGITPDDITLVRDRTNLLLIRGEGMVTVVSQFMNDGRNDYAMDAIEFADGTIWNREDMLSHLTQGTALDNSLFGDSTDDTLDGLGGNDRLYGAGGNDTLNGGEGNDLIYGQDGQDTLVGGVGDDALVGGSGSDSLTGGSGNDTIKGSLGDDTLQGGSGDDEYVYILGDGMDVIDNTGGGIDRLSFIDVTTERLCYRRDGDDLVVLVDNNLGQSVRVASHFLGGDAAIDVIRASDGAEIAANDIDALLTPSLIDGGQGNYFLIEAYLAQDNINRFDTVYTDSDTQSLAPANMVERIEADGSLLFNNQVDQLVTAMAAYDVPAGVGNVLPQEVSDELQPVLAENWQAIA